jgi:murein DD-endopeptidase MepM/ murein hydrolase activator NlpD
VLGHEAYRDGVVTDDNYLETRTATAAHTEMAIRMIRDGQSLSILNDNLIKDVIAYSQNTDAFNAYVDSNYDSSADYWKLMRDGTLVNNNSGWLVDEEGRFIRNADGERIGADEIETGLLNILYGGTHAVGYSQYNDEQVGFVQMLMTTAEMNYTEKVSGNRRSRTWTDNEEKSLNMNDVMTVAGATIASQVFARYYENNAVSFTAWLSGKDIGTINEKVLTFNARARYFEELLPSFMNYYSSMRSFFDASAGFRVTAEHGATDPRYVYANYEKGAHFGTDFANGKSGDSIYLGISGKVIYTDVDDLSRHKNGNWMAVEYGYMFENSFIGSGIYGEYMHMEAAPNFANNSFLNSNQIIGTVGNTGRSSGAHLHYTMYTLENYSYSQPTLQLLLNNNISNTVLSERALNFNGTHNRVAKKITYNIENFLNGL